MFSALLRYCYPVIPESVYREVTVSGHTGSDFFSDLCEKGVITVYKTTERFDLSLSFLHEGERGVIDIFYEGKGDFVIMDDGKGGAFCRDNNIPYINALLAVKIMLMKKIVTEAEYADARRWLLKYGRYSEKVKLWTDNADEHMLSFFL